MLLLVRDPAGVDPETAEKMRNQVEQQSRARMRHNSKRFHGKGWLRQGLNIDRARNVPRAYASSELHGRFRLPRPHQGTAPLASSATIRIRRTRRPRRHGSHPTARGKPHTSGQPKAQHTGRCIQRYVPQRPWSASVMAQFDCASPLHGLRRYGLAHSAGRSVNDAASMGREDPDGSGKDRDRLGHRGGELAGVPERFIHVG